MPANVIQLAQLFAKRIFDSRLASREEIENHPAYRISNHLDPKRDSAPINLRNMRGSPSSVDAALGFGRFQF
jgi:uncharacterized protein (DUF1684 family)